MRMYYQNIRFNDNLQVLLDNCTASKSVIRVRKEKSVTDLQMDEIKTIVYHLKKEK
jgi:hypothetical protein